ncbi:hypothetical protein ABEM52_18030 [Escherichia coli]
MTLSFFITVIPDHDKPQPPGCLLGLIFSLRIKFLAIPLMIVFSLVWGAIGYSIGALFESTAASIVLGIIAFLSGLGTHFAAVQWANDIAE